MISRIDIQGFILAGGLSSRLGTPKALVEVEGTPIVARVLAALSSVVSSVTVVTDRPSEVSFLHVPVIPDRKHASGPLGGLHAALSAAGSDTIALVSCDLPFLTPDLFRSLIARHGAWPVTVPRTDRLHPVCALYDRRLLDLAESRLKAGQRSMHGFLETVGYKTVPLSSLDPPIDPRVLTNVNTPEDLRAVRSTLP